MCTGKQVLPKLKGNCQGSCSGSATARKLELSAEKQHESCHGSGAEEAKVHKK
jgi:hypothetical protein